MTDIFDENNKPKDEGNPNPDDKSAEGVGTIETYLGLMTNEQGEQKYANAEEALKGSIHAQSHIAKLESELKELRESSDKSTGMEQILEALNNGKAPEDKSKEIPPSLTQEDIANVVTAMLDNRDTVTTEKQNITTVVDKFRSVYGEKASETMYAKANDLGFSKDDINKLIATNPNASLKILGMEGEVKPDAEALNLGSNNTTDFQHKSEEKVASSMGYISSKQLEDNFKKSQARTLERLGVTIDNP